MVNVFEIPQFQLAVASLPASSERESLFAAAQKAEAAMRKAIDRISEIDSERSVLRDQIVGASGTKYGQILDSITRLDTEACYLPSAIGEATYQWASALTAAMWHVRQELIDEGNDANEQVRIKLADGPRLDRVANDGRMDPAERDRAQERLTEVLRSAAPHQELHSICRDGIGFAEINLRRFVPDFNGRRPSEEHLRAYARDVQKNFNRKAAA